MKIQFSEFLEKNLKQDDISVSYEVLENDKILIKLKHDNFSTESIFSKNEILRKLFNIRD